MQSICPIGPISKSSNTSGPFLAEFRCTRVGGAVVEDLRGQGLLRHAWPLVFWARVSRADRRIHWGEYLITTPLSPLELLARGEITPVVDREVPFADLPAALEAMAARETIGRVVVRLA